jgi:hypothetical protein
MNKATVPARLLARVGEEKLQSYLMSRKGARVVESAGLENRCGLRATVGSNPTPSAKLRPATTTARLRLAGTNYVPLPQPDFVWQVAPAV